jgi:hypothetical protein
MKTTSSPVQSLGFPASAREGLAAERYRLLTELVATDDHALWLARRDGKYGFSRLLAIHACGGAVSACPLERERFLAAARLAARLEHVNVTATLDLGDEGGAIWMATEWVEGVTLRTLAERAEEQGVVVPLGVLLRIASDVCAGLQAAHEVMGGEDAGLFALEKGPSLDAILVSVAGVTKVCSFRLVRSGAREAHRDDVLAPEELAQRGGDARTGLWRLGQHLRTLLGSRPLPEEVAALLACVTAPDPSDRFASARDFRAAIEKALLAIGAAAAWADVEAFVASVSTEEDKAARGSVSMLARASEPGPVPVRPSSRALQKETASVPLVAESEATTRKERVPTMARPSVLPAPRSSRPPRAGQGVRIAAAVSILATFLVGVASVAFAAEAAPVLAAQEAP